MLDNNVIVASFETAAEVHGDITEQVYGDFLKNHPEANQFFLIRGEQYEANLKERMVQDAIYSLLEYLDDPEEIDIMFKYVVPQHQDLGIPTHYFGALLESIAEVVCSAVASDKQPAAQKHWQLLVEKFEAIVEKNKQ